MRHHNIHQVENVIRSVLEDIRGENEFVYSILKYSIDSGGKRIRPALALFCADMISNKLDGHMQKIYVASACVELLHTASLILDDIIDEASIRRGRPAAYKVFGTKISVIASAYLLGVVSEMISSLGSIRLVELFSSAAKTMAEGQVLESKIMVQNILEPDVENLIKLYFQVIEKKTAPLFALSSSLPFIICEDIVSIASGCQLAKAFSNIGHLIGVSFQVKDDILDFVSSSTGKPNLNDVKEGKLTLPVLLSENFEVIFNIMKNSKDGLDTEKLEEILKLVKEGRGIEKAEEKLRQIIEEARELVNNVSSSGLGRESIYEIINFIYLRSF